MEKACEFCKSVRPIVYCKAEAAHLCLVCDAKVHSANTLSNRHPRALLCELCKYHPAYVRCDDHGKFICSGCDRSLHKDTNQPQKRMVYGYTGCPSAQGFASLWGFDMDNVWKYCDVQIPVRYRFGKKVRGCLENSTRGIESEVEPSSTNVLCKENQNISTIFQQIIDLEKLQLSELNNRSSVLRAKRQSFLSSSIFDTLSKLDRSLQHPLSAVTDSNQEMGMIEPFTSSFSPLEDLASSSSVGDCVWGEPFWKCESHYNDFKMWSENIQELGACEESSFFDNSNIPDVDVSFRNFEELFECDQGMDTELLDEKELSTSSMENYMTSLCKVDCSYAKDIEDASAASSMDIDIGLPDQANTFLDNVDRSYPTRKFDSTSLTLSCVSAHGKFTDYKDTSFSPLVVRPQEPNPSEQKSAKVEGEGRALWRYKDKKNSRFSGLYSQEIPSYLDQDISPGHQRSKQQLHNLQQKPSM